MLNTCTFMGRFVRDPELRTTSGGNSVTSFTIACERDFRGSDGEKVSDFIDCVSWNATAEYIARNFAKGKMAVVTGSLQFRDWTDKNGNKRKNAEIQVSNIYFADSKKDEYTAPQYPQKNNEFQEIDDAEQTDLPF